MGACLASPRRSSEESGAGWAITAQEQVLGQVGLRWLDLDEGHAKVSYWVVPTARGNHVATRALGSVTSWSFERLGLHRLEVLHSVANPASCRVALNAGYVVEGTRRSQGLHPDGWHDMHLHAQLRGGA